MLAALPAAALDPPPLAGRVNDLAGLLAPERRAALEARLEAYERETSHQIVVLTVPSLEGDPIEDFSIRVAEQWRIGQRGLDNGLIVIVAPQERRARIEVGYGLEGVVPDAVAARILREHMIPEFSAGRMDAGLEAGVAALMQAARGEQVDAMRRPRARHPRVHDGLGLVVFAAFASSMAGAPLRRRGARLVGGLAIGLLAGLVVYWISRAVALAAAAGLAGGAMAMLGPSWVATPRRGRGHGGFGGFGGGGFGGGGFGGGGASGSW